MDAALGRYREEEYGQKLLLLPSHIPHRVAFSRPLSRSCPIAYPTFDVTNRKRHGSLSRYHTVGGPVDEGVSSQRNVAESGLTHHCGNIADPVCSWKRNSWIHVPGGPWNIECNGYRTSTAHGCEHRLGQWNSCENLVPRRRPRMFSGLKSWLIVQEDVDRIVTEDSSKIL